MIYVVDASDHERFSLAKKELDHLLEEEDLKAVATINKIALNLIEMQRLWKDGAEFTKD